MSMVDFYGPLCYMVNRVLVTPIKSEHIHDRLPYARSA
jgi:hypothetical protein